MDTRPQVCTLADAIPIVILGVPFDSVTTTDTLALIDRMVQSRQPHYIATANIDFLVQALDDVELRRILFDANLVLCDGTPLLWASRLLGNRLPERVAGSDVVPILIGRAAEMGYRVFFLGGSPDATEEAVCRLKEKYPKLQLAGWYSPPYSALLEMDHDEISRRIRAAAPDVLFVSFGCPKQEKWIAMHYRSLGIPVAVGVGGTIDFLAGRLQRAPQWMRRTGTEWVYRLAQEPGRLAKRYARDLLCFGPSFARQLWHLRVRRRGGRSQCKPIETPPSANWTELATPDWLDRDAVQQHAAQWEAALTRAPDCVVRLDGVQFIDSTGVGFLIRLQKRTRNAGGQLVLLAPTEPVRRALSLMRLDGFFRMAADAGEVRALLQAAHARRSCAAVQSRSFNASPMLVWQGELTAANAAEVWQITEKFIRCVPRVTPQVEIDSRQLRFIDSSGLGVMIRTRKLARQQQLQLRFTDLQPAVINVIRLARLEAFLMEAE